jgi:hypothetical protein
VWKEIEIMEGRTPYLVVPFLLLFLALFPFPAYAQHGKLGLRLWGEGSPLISGEAGSGPGAPGYNDAFHAGLGIGAEISWRITPRLSLLTGIGYEDYRGDSHQGISFANLEIVPVYLGAKFHITPDAHRWNPYLRMDIGAAHLSSVDVSYQWLKGKYWDSSWAFLFDAGAGIEYRWKDWGASLEIKLRYTGKPVPALGLPSNAEPFWTVPVAFGITYYF